jgi:gentisate 1,2-dioxygenase
MQQAAGALDARKRYYDRISAKNLTPLWEVLHSLVPATPQSLARAALWRYQDLREDLMESGTLITAREAVRRVLILENPALRGQSRITQSLYAGLQLILPGEVAPAHRHSQSALRMVMEGEGAYTAVNGERTTMKRGDFIITPANTWHDHGNPGNQPVVWLDGLDIPLVQYFEAGFAETAEQEVQEEARPEGDALARYGSNMLPMDYRAEPADPTRVFVYPYAKTRAALADLCRSPADPHFGHKLRFVNPANGASPMPTIGAFIQLLPSGMQTLPYRSTDGSIYTCLEGGGVALVNGEEFRFGPNDIFVVPSWHTLQLQAGSQTVLFSFSDRPVQQVLGLWREQKLPA